jgi:ABC-type glycerol-3-phosphate transport system permease component
MTTIGTLRPERRTEHAPPAPRPFGRRRLTRTGRYVVMAAFALAFLAPLLWMLGTSLRPEADVTRDPMAFIPTTFRPQNYGDAFSTILPFFVNSVKLAVFSVIGVLIVASLAGYAFARLQFRGRSLLFGVVLATSIVPQIVYLLPQYAFFQELNWIDTQYPLWVPRVLTPVFGTFLLRQAFRTLPKELEDASRLDGCTTFQIFWRVMLPQVKPALATVGVFTFVESWNDLFGPLIFINSTELQTLPLALSLFQGEFFTTISTLMAASTITVLPVLVVYVFAQRYFVEGIASSGLKG